MTRKGMMLSIKRGRLELDKRNNFFTLKIVRHWHRLTREVVDGPLTEIIPGQLLWDFEQPDLIKGISAHC